MQSETQTQQAQVEQNREIADVLDIAVLSQPEKLAVSDGEQRFIRRGGQRVDALQF
jgi:hypothetical protein